MPSTDVLILGSGQAGVPLAVRLARAGRHVVLVERGELGGTCVNTGCTPTKTLIASAEAAHRARTAGPLGVTVGTVQVDMGAVADRVEGMVREWRASVADTVGGVPRLQVVRGHGWFTAPRTVEVDGTAWNADTVVVDVGARPSLPPLDGLDRVPWLDNHGLLSLREVPRRLLVLGGGFIGCELGQAFRRLGSEVVVVEAGDHLLGPEEPEAGACIADVFNREGIDVRTGGAARSVRVDHPEVVLTLDDDAEVRGSHLLVATGRRPNTDDLGVEAAGVELDERGYVVVDDAYRTSVEGVHAVGDCTGAPQFTHRAWDDHRVLFDILMGARTGGRAGRVVPRATFTDPQVASVGLSEADARERGHDPEVAVKPFHTVARARETGRPDGLIKVVYDPSSDRLLGACVVGAEAAELIAVYQMLMQADASPGAMVAGQVIHPSFAEGLHAALMDLDRYRLS